MLTRVTITGADDATDPRLLAHLSAEFPFVEWGVLFSTTRINTARYPSQIWVERLFRAAGGAAHLSAHLCGGIARDTLAGISGHLAELPAFDRVQVNGFTPPSPGLASVAMAFKHIEFILQCRREVDLQATADVAVQMPDASVLFDPSGGRGIEGFTYPLPPLGLRLGYAGGIGPNNVNDVLRTIGVVDGDFWIDMESGVRTNDQLDLDKVRSVLFQARSWMSSQHRGVQ